MAQETRARKARESQESFKSLRMRIEQACEFTNESIRKGWWKETKGLLGQGPRPTWGAQGVDASKARVREYEESIQSGIRPKRHRFWCVSRVNGKLRSYIA